MNFWSENIDLLWHAAAAYQRGTLSVFTGAGLSCGCGLPVWPDLVRELHVEVARRQFPQHEVYGTYDAPKGWGGLAVAQTSLELDVLKGIPLPIQSRYCKERLGADYRTVLQQVLYKRNFKASKSVTALAGLTKLKAVCTYNYDDLIESSAKSRPFRSITGPVENKIDAVPVYHVHGLPPADLSPPSGDIVFSEDEYHAMYANSTHWSNLIQLSLLMQSECVLFLGLSFEDPNLRRLLDAARNAQPDIRFINVCRFPMKRPLDEPNPLSPARATRSTLESLYGVIGVKLLWVDEFEPDITFVLQALGADDPIATYTTLWRRFLRGRLDSMPREGPCQHIRCSDSAVKGFRFCPLHELGGRDRYMDYAPMPKNLQDVCQVDGCRRISIGLSKLCVEHIGTN